MARAAWAFGFPGANALTGALAAAGRDRSNKPTVRESTASRQTRVRYDTIRPFIVRVPIGVEEHRAGPTRAKSRRTNRVQPPVRARQPRYRLILAFSGEGVKSIMSLPGDGHYTIGR